MDSEKTLFIYTDGGSRGNPGEAACGVFITNAEGERIASLSKRLGVTTNNIAEYKGLLTALSWVLDNESLVASYKAILCRLDSELLVRQLTGVYKVKDTTLKALYLSVLAKMQTLTIPVSFAHIRREFNKEADTMVNLALDNLL